MQTQEQEIPEIVGSKDLREVFDGGEVKGSFYLNNVEFHQFQANSIENLIAQINAKELETFVTATIDDGYHLVLEAHSPAPILLRSGRHYVETPAAGTDATAQAVRAALEASKEEHKEHRNTVLEDLGLESTHPADAPSIPFAMQPGMSADDRRKARHDRAVARGAIRGVPEAHETASSGSRAVPQVGAEDGNRKFNPVTPADKVQAQDRAALGNQQSKDWEPGANNPTFQHAPISNSDGQPTVNDL